MDPKKIIMILECMATNLTGRLAEEKSQAEEEYIKLRLDTIDQAILAVKKQIPKTVSAKKLDKDVYLGVCKFEKGTSILVECPTCKKYISKHDKFCRYCGQAIKLEVE